MGTIADRARAFADRLRAGHDATARVPKADAREFLKALVELGLTINAACVDRIPDPRTRETVATIL